MIHHNRPLPDRRPPRPIHRTTKWRIHKQARLLSTFCLARSRMTSKPGPVSARDTSASYCNDYHSADNLSTYQRNAYIRVIQKLFRPANATLAAIRLFSRDLGLANKADDAIARYAASGAPESSVERVKLKTWLEVETFLCTEYRYVLLL